ncbi:hypothetical protein NX059_007839 [Plenodomus lindquistii]|nr:hypothetical protein NX059_007839 [Plenodomus lindquistii]
MSNPDSQKELVPRRLIINIVIWCPSLNPIGAVGQIRRARLNISAGYAQCILALKTTLRAPLAFAHDKDGNTIEDFSLLTKNDFIIVTTDYFESPKNMWTKNLQGGYQETAWLQLIPPQRRDYMQSLRCRCCRGKHTKLILTLPIRMARYMLPYIVERHKNPPDERQWGIQRQKLRDCWDRSVDNFMGIVGLIPPKGDVWEWDPVLLPTLGLLASATAGQAELAWDEVMRVVGAREPDDRVITIKDLRQVLGDLYGDSEMYAQEGGDEEQELDESEYGEVDFGEVFDNGEGEGGHFGQSRSEGSTTDENQQVEQQAQVQEEDEFGDPSLDDVDWSELWARWPQGSNLGD